MFLDASVLVAASRSPSGGSAVSLEVCQGTKFRAAVTEEVLSEARVNVAGKFGDAELVRFYEQFAATEPLIVPPPPVSRIEECEPLTTDKDAHVLAAAIEAGAAYLLTLDRRHLLNDRVIEANLPVRVMTPRDFLQQIVRDT